MALVVLSMDSLEVTQVKTDCKGVTLPAFSPRGDYLAWACGDNPNSVPIYLRRLNDGKVTELVRGMQGIGGLAWSSDGRRIVFSTPWPSGDLWEVELARPDRAQKLPFGHDAEYITVSYTGHRLAYTQNHTNTNIWRVDLSNPQAPTQKIVASSREQTAPNYSPDGTQIAFQSNRSGSSEIWGRYVYFSYDDGQLRQVKTDGGGEQQVEGMPLMASIDAWNPFGSAIYFLASPDNEKLEIDFFDLNTKAVRTIFAMNKFPPDQWGGWNGGLPISPDGRWMLFAQMDEFSSDLMMVENWQ